MRHFRLEYILLYLHRISVFTQNLGQTRQFRQITKNKPSFTNDDSLRRMLYLASRRIVQHWHARCQNWDMVLSQLEIMFADRRAG